MAAVKKTETPKIVATSAKTTATPVSMKTVGNEDQGTDKKIFVIAVIVVVFIVALILWKRK